MSLVFGPLALEVEATLGTGRSGLACFAGWTTVLASRAADPVGLSWGETAVTFSGSVNRPRKIGVDMVLGPLLVFSDSFDTNAMPCNSLQ